MKNVLVVDDEKSVRDSIKMILDYEKYSVLFAENGAKAIASFKENNPDAVFLDIKMPGGIDGIDVLREMKQINAEIPVIMISGHGTFETAVEATKLGAYDYLPKPEGVEKLLEESALASDQDSLEKNENAVKLMTVHASKGLEFDYIFVTGLEQDLFPHQGMGTETKTPEEMEEERRLFYVALTRARIKLFLTYAEMRTIYGSQQINLPSIFLGEFDNEYLEEENFEYREKIVYLEW